MRRILATSLAALLASATASMQAQAPPPAEQPLPPRYEVELIVFAHSTFDPSEERFDRTFDGFGDDAATALRDAPVFGDTSLPFPEPLGDPRLADPLPPNPVSPEPLLSDPLPPVDPLAAARAEALRVRLLKPEELKLGSEYRRLAAIAAYRPLLHVGWVQPGLSEADSEDIDLKVFGALNPSGTVRVHLIRYLHVTLDVTYQAAGFATPAFGASDGLEEVALAPRYRLTTTRSVRSGELHYFDHPAFGVLVRVTPVPTETDGERRPAA